MGITVSRLSRPLSLFLLSLSVHLLPFFVSGTHPLGYDTGFYRRYLLQPFTSFPNTVVPGLGSDALIPRLVLDVLRATGLWIDLVLYGSYIVFFSLIPVLLYYWLAPRLGRRGALLAGLLLALSPVGYTAYWYMLYKNALALCLILLAFIAYEKRAFWPLIALELLLTLSHKTSAIMYLVTLAALLLVDRERWRETALHLGITAASLGLVFFFADISVPTSGAQAVAVFMTRSDYLIFSAGLLIAAGYAYIRREGLTFPSTLLAFALASFAFPLLGLPFYERIFVFSNVALSGFAAAGLGLLASKVSFEGDTRPYAAFALVCLILGLQLGNLNSRIRELGPLITEESLETISTIGASLPRGAILLTTNSEAPWYEGWTEAHIAAPGMLKDNHSLEEWVAFWEATTTPAQVAFLNSFPQPLYVSTLDTVEDLINTPPPCLTRITENLLRNDCAR